MNARLHGTILLIAACALAMTTPAAALERCKAVIKSRDGTIEVQAKDVQGTLRWGNIPDSEVNEFFNGDTCVKDGKARKCVFGAPGTVERITPPASCTVYLDDGSSPQCSAYIKKCIPGTRGNHDDPLVATCLAIRGTPTCDLEEILGTVGNCTSYAGTAVSGACWFLGAALESCDDKCTGEGLVYDDATRFFAGSHGTDARCEAVLEALGLPQSGLGNPTSSTCGCYATVSGDLGNRALPTTDSSCNAAGIQRACACK